MDYPYHYYFVSAADVFGGLVRSPAFWLIMAGMLAVSAYHDRRTLATFHAYAERRGPSAVETAPWPGDAAFLRLGPHLLYAGGAVALLLGFLQTANAVVNTVLDVLMRSPRLTPPAAMVLPAVGAVALGWLLVALARRIRRSPWYPVAECLRRAVYATGERREALFAKALEVDPGTPRGTEA